MKLIGPPGTEIRHILATYIMCPCDLDLIYVPILKFVDILVFEIFDLKLQI